MNATALIAEDEPLLAASLRSMLGRCWPELSVVACVGDGESAVQQALVLRADVLFLDIRMPGLSGLEAAAALAEDWPESGSPFPLIVFVTAYDQYALQAFERAAVDYVLKPVQLDRLAQTCGRLQALLKQRATPAGLEPALAQAMDQLRALLASAQEASWAPAARLGPTSAATGAPAPAPAPAAPPVPLRFIPANAGATTTLVPVDEVLYFEAADKYVRVVTAQREHLIRLSLRELQPQLDPQRFWQVHRGTIVQCSAVASAQRDHAGKVLLTLHGHADKLSVSRLYAPLFKGL